ncbi:uncharacterized protein DS421_16g549630 [Arachis hypogaea]|nr:uncharacterized protein DS421_16g549630 [Arachis hypogaea]
MLPLPVTLSKIRFKQTQIRLWFGISSKQDPSSSMKTNRDMKFLYHPPPPFLCDVMRE